MTKYTIRAIRLDNKTIAIAAYDSISQCWYYYLIENDGRMGIAEDKRPGINAYSTAAETIKAAKLYFNKKR